MLKYISRPHRRLTVNVGTLRTNNDGVAVDRYRQPKLIERCTVATRQRRLIFPTGRLRAIPCINIGNALFFIAVHICVVGSHDHPITSNCNTIAKALCPSRRRGDLLFGASRLKQHYRAEQRCYAQ